MAHILKCEEPWKNCYSRQSHICYKDVGGKTRNKKIRSLKKMRLLKIWKTENKKLKEY